MPSVISAVRAHQIARLFDDRGVRTSRSTIAEAVISSPFRGRRHGYGEQIRPTSLTNAMAVLSVIYERFSAQRTEMRHRMERHKIKEDERSRSSPTPHNQLTPSRATWPPSSSGLARCPVPVKTGAGGAPRAGPPRSPGSWPASARRAAAQPHPAHRRRAVAVAAWIAEATVSRMVARRATCRRLSCLS
jgi:hypothetical protein